MTVNFVVIIKRNKLAKTPKCTINAISNYITPVFIDFLMM